MSASDRYQYITPTDASGRDSSQRGPKLCRVNQGSPLRWGNGHGSIVSRLTRGASLLAVLAVMMIAIEPLPGANAFGSDTLVTAPPAHYGGGIGPVAGLIDDLIDLIEEIVEAADEAEEAVGANTGPLVDPVKSEVAGYLDDLERLIDQILDPNLYPSLVPPEAGAEDPIVNPTTLPEYAVDSRDLAQDALDEAMSLFVDYESIGTNLKNIKGLLPTYRDKAGM